MMNVEVIVDNVVNHSMVRFKKADMVGNVTGRRHINDCRISEHGSECKYFL